ncbi:MAG: hypothetical protein KC505_07605 [Myxococcales bacterium]|nr:hypothetical protein [Myxococcales bacterium]USN51566.1 MAG: hypothetical protein H6731_03925 [Myxococcales bacterium]
MSRVDGQLKKIFEDSGNIPNTKGKELSKNETIKLISCAEDINNNPSKSCFTSSSSSRGTRQLAHLFKRHQNEFSQESKQVLKNYIQHGQIPSNNQSFHNSTVTHGVSPSLIHHSHSTGAVVMPTTPTRPNHSSGPVVMPTTPAGSNHSSGSVAMPTAPVGSNHSSGSVVMPTTPARPNHSSGPVVTPTTPAGSNYNSGSVVMPTTPAGSNHSSGSVAMPTTPARPEVGETPTPATSNADVAPLGIPVPGSVSNNGVEGTHGTVILDWKASKAVEHFHWFPLQETQPNGGDATNNLYAPKGACAKYDMYTGTSKAREYEYEHNRKPLSAGAEFGWWGHCDKASTASCVLQAPKHDVIMLNDRGEKIRFTKNDIQGLLVKVVSNLAEKVDFRGHRYNGPRDNPNDPSPQEFMSVMKEWGQDQLPFVLDIDPGVQVWNFPYDQVKIQESTQAPAGFNAANMPNDGSVKYYHIDMKGTGFPQKARVYDCFVRYGAGGEVVESDWIKTPQSHKKPDFMWRPHPVGDLRDRSLWVNHGKVSNPEIDPQVVYDIYMKSLA